MVLGLSCWEVHGHAIRVRKIDDSPDFFNNELHAPKPLEANKSSFGSDIYNPNSQCKAAIESAASKFPELADCYAGGSLYFSSPNTVCSSKCYDITVKAAQIISEGCGSKLDGNTPKPLRAYGAWSNTKLAYWACNGGTDSSNSCIHAIPGAQTSFANYESAPGLPRSQLKKDVCSKCITDWASLVQGNAYMTPALYYADALDPPELLKKVVDLCLFASAVCVAGRFGSDLALTGTHRCKAAIDKANANNPKLASCIPQGSLYFTSIETVCENKCNMIISKPSQDIYDACKSENQSLSDNINSYRTWGNPSLANWACSGGNSRCFGILNDISGRIANDPSQAIPEEELCGNCSLDWLSKISGDPNNTPVLYYGKLLNPQQLYEKIKTCSR
ncbi:hypothetical protein H4219_001164 [Mycoemilia scoparia]|uniref:Uncharacterized protein n=1 Tax=Mycoemilia scoparia TaxID=417184 RepID=A0A9W8DS43_9FUNG|nr:hypothetical protein H4219_001164 [Mycoemilia scoparia]